MFQRLLLCFLSCFGCMSCCSRSIENTKIGKEVTAKLKSFCETQDDLIFGRWKQSFFYEETLPLHFDFTSYRRVDMDEARVLCIRCCEEIQRVISSFDELRPFMENYPFPPYNFSMGILFSQPEKRFEEWDRSHLVRDGMDSVGIAHGDIYYAKWDEDLQGVRMFYKEACLPARRIVRAQDEQKSSL